MGFLFFIYFLLNSKKQVSDALMGVGAPSWQEA